MSIRAFIIRPFGTKRDVNLDAFEATLINPALERLATQVSPTLAGQAGEDVCAPPSWLSLIARTVGFAR